ncbi:conserved uncharacterized protein [Stigmatella aurantiaca DW4/3-1]|nr:conserved uncharacterized protein [Stigmatella aurantiaca DW4/3-1]
MALNRIAMAMLAASPFMGCTSSTRAAHPAPPPCAPASQRRPLRVSLYTLPANTEYRAALEQAFECEHRDIDLLLAETDVGRNYDPSEVAQALQTSVDVVEIDTLLLGDVAAKMEALGEGLALAPWGSSPPASEFHPAAIEASTLNGRALGWPHWMCGKFVLSTDEAVASAATVANLRAALGVSGRLAVDLGGSWSVPLLLLDESLDDRQDRRVEFDPAAIRSTDTYLLLREHCRTGDSLPCAKPERRFDTSGALAETGAWDALFDGTWKGYIGYSEHLFSWLPAQRRQAPHATPHIGSLVLGPASHPLWMVDAFVRGPACASHPQCALDAETFVRFASSPEGLAAGMWLQGPDAAPGQGVPRYLLPAAKRAWDDPRVAKDRLYSHLKELASQPGSPAPNGGFAARYVNITPKLRDQMNQAP